MATPNTLGSRRNAAQLRALVGVEREVRANDSSSRRKYLRDFSQAYRSYESVIDSQTLAKLVNAADIVLIGDYHALPASQRFAASLIEERAQPGDRPIVLGVETIFARHQHVLDEWWRREIDENEFRERIRFDADWGYDWAPFYELLVTARQHGEGVYGLDCMPREDLRKIGTRDRHAVDKIGEIREKHPRAVIFVLFGESHFAPQHVPKVLHQRLTAERALTVLQNVDALYWNAANERQDRVDAVQVRDNVVCVFNSTPLEKYESYRLYLSRCQADAGQADLVPTIYNLIDTLACFLDINRYSSHNSTQPRFLVDMLPEVYSGNSDARLRQLLLRALQDPARVENVLRRVEAQGSVYLPSINAVYVREFQMAYAAEEACRFLHHACRGLPLRRNGQKAAASEAIDRFYARAVEHALASFGSRVLYPARASEKDDDGAVFSFRLCERTAANALRHDRAHFDDAAQKLGYRLGSQLYDAYLRGSVSQPVLRALFLAHIDEGGQSRRVVQEILRRIRSTSKKPSASVRS